MKELELISKTTAAVVSFNYAEIDAQLDEVLKKYGGLLFTDETVAECKKTITELKKGKKSLNDFKIKTKKLLTADITKFEDQCKKLSDKFDTVIDPIGIQAEAFEVKRKQDKENEITTIIETLNEERDLSKKYYDQLIITDSMLNKGPTIKSITEDLTKQADSLLSQQNVEKANIELIKSKVELAIATYGVPLLDTQYISMMEYSNVTEITKLIMEDAEALKKRNEEIELQKVIRAEKLEAERVAAEVRKSEREEELKKARETREINERINQERQARLAEERAKVVRVTTAAPVVKSAPVEVIAPPVIVNIETDIFVEHYKIEGTETELNALEDYLNANNFTWAVETNE